MEIVHVLHIGKTGGTFLKSILTETPSTKYKFLMHSHRISLKLIPKGQKVIFIYRDPIKRFISSYYSGLRKGIPAHFNEWNQNEDLFFTEYNTLDKVIKALKKSEISFTGIRHLNRSFSYWLKDVKYIDARKEDLFFICDLVNLNDNLCSLKEKFSLKKEIDLSKTFSHKGNIKEKRSISNDQIHILRKYLNNDFTIYEFLKLLS